jgi:hypothetical protein
MNEVLIGAGTALAIALVAWGVQISRWTARVQTLLEINSTEVTSLRATRHEHASLLAELDGRVRHIELNEERES